MPDRLSEAAQQFAPAMGLAFLGQFLRLLLARQRPHWKRAASLLVAAPIVGAITDYLGRQKGFEPWAINAAVFICGAVVLEVFQTIESLSGRVAADPLGTVADAANAVRGVHPEEEEEAKS